MKTTFLELWIIYILKTNYRIRNFLLYKKIYFEKKYIKSSNPFIQAETD